ncbi:hypothetical protein JHK87_021954 [Glycine soja]|nr:hypothetical protein JHK87_021954 [Glycine soja]
MASLKSVLSLDSNYNFDELQWVVQIRRTLEEELDEDGEFPVSIFSIPKLLRACDPDSYIPQQVALGTYHYWRPELYEMQRIRACHHKFLDFNGETSVWMMTVDASFLLEFLQVFYCAIQDGTKVARGKSYHNAILRDIVMLENQIPMFLLRNILEFKFSSLEAVDDTLMLEFIKRQDTIEVEVQQGDEEKEGNEESNADSSHVKQLFSELWKLLSKLNKGPSVAFSGISPVVIGAVWCFIVALCFTIIALVHCLCCCCCRKKKPRTDYSRKTYAISLIFLSVFLIMTIIGGGFLYTGLGKFQATAHDVSDILVTRATTVVDIIQNVIDNLHATKDIQVASFYLPDDIKGAIEKAEKFSTQTDYIKNQSEETARISMEFLGAISESLIIVGTMMLILAAVGFANANMPPIQADKDIYYNQSGPSMPLLCNPFLPDLTERACGPMEVDLKGASIAYQSFLCNTSPNGRCITMGRLTPSLYTKVMVATNMSDTLRRHGPLLARLVDCSFVVDTFDQINKDDCQNFKRYSNQIFIGLVLVSAAVMFSVILWIVFVRERQVQISSKKFKKTLVEAQ